MWRLKSLTTKSLLQLHRNTASGNARGVLCPETGGWWRPTQWDTSRCGWSCCCGDSGSGKRRNRRWPQAATAEEAAIQARDARPGTGGRRRGQGLLLLRRAVDQLLLADINDDVGNHVADTASNRKCRQWQRALRNRKRGRQRDRKNGCGGKAGRQAQAAASCALLRREELLGLRIKPTTRLHLISV